MLEVEQMADKTKQESLHAMLPNTLFSSRLMDIAIKAKRNFQKILDSIWQSEKAMNRAEEE